jgi:hypothetical protein
VVLVALEVLAVLVVEEAGLPVVVDLRLNDCVVLGFKSSSMLRDGKSYARGE